MYDYVILSHYDSLCGVKAFLHSITGWSSRWQIGMTSEMGPWGRALETPLSWCGTFPTTTQGPRDPSSLISMSSCSMSCNVIMLLVFCVGTLQLQVWPADVRCSSFHVLVLCVLTQKKGRFVSCQRITTASHTLTISYDLLLNANLNLSWPHSCDQSLQPTTTYRRAFLVLGCFRCLASEGQGLGTLVTIYPNETRPPNITIEESAEVKQMKNSY